MEHTLHDLEVRLQRLRHSISPPRFMSELHESEESATPSPNGNDLELSENFPLSPTEGLAEHSGIATPFPAPFVYDGDSTPPHCKHCPTRDAPAAGPSHEELNSEQRGEIEPTTDLGKLINTFLQHVQSTDSPPRYLSTHDGPSSMRRRETTLIEEEEPLRNNNDDDAAASTKHARLGNPTAYPTPLPSSPETKPSRKRGREGGFQGDGGGGGRKRRRDGDEEWMLERWGRVEVDDVHDA